MNNEETRLINDVADSQNQQVRTSKGRYAAVGAGGFVAGVAAGMGVTAAAASM